MVRPIMPRYEVYVIFRHSNNVDEMLPASQGFGPLTLTDIFVAVLLQAKVDLNGTDTKGFLYTVEGPGISGGDMLRCFQRRYGPERFWPNDFECIKGRMMQRVNDAVERLSTEKSTLRYFLIVQACRGSVA